jgi:hypothetical protein
MEYFRFARFRFELEAESDIHLPVYKGSALRGGFGHAFRKSACIAKGQECPDCILRAQCAYAYIFETPPPADTVIMRKYPHAPHPFVIEPPLEPKRHYSPGESLGFELVLIGKGMDYFPYFVYAFEELGKIGLGKGKGGYALRQAYEVNNGKPALVYDGAKRQLKGKLEAQTLAGLTEEPLTLPSPARGEGTPHPNPLPQGERDALILRFLTPVRIVFEESLAPSLEFHVLIRNLLRRLSTLSYFHCGKALELDFKGFITKAQEVQIEKTRLKWHDWERYSNRQETKMKMGGLIGEVVYRGPWREFLPFLLLGEEVHVGKGTTFGLGKYRIQREEPSPCPLPQGERET